MTTRETTPKRPYNGRRANRGYDGRPDSPECQRTQRGEEFVYCGIYSGGGFELLEKSVWIQSGPMCESLHIPHIGTAHVPVINGQPCWVLDIKGRRLVQHSTSQQEAKREVLIEWARMLELDLAIVRESIRDIDNPEDAETEGNDDLAQAALIELKGELEK